MDPLKLTRKDLYDLVWSTPMIRLAERFGVSDVALRKKCHKHGIPTPPIGYWAKLAAKKSVKRPPLPKSFGSGSDEIVFDPVVAPVQREAKPVLPKIEVRERLEEPHAAVAWLQKQLKEAEADQYGRLSAGLTWHPTCSVRSRNVDRTLRLLQALVECLVARGYEVSLHHPDLRVAMDEDCLDILIEERLARKPHVSTTREPAWHRRKWDYYPDDRLSFRLYRYGLGYAGKAAWYDTKHTKLEATLGGMVLGIDAVFQVGRDERLKREEVHREYARRERVRLHGERLKAYRLWLAQDLERMADTWAKGARLRGFLSAYTSKLPEGATEPEWLLSARAYADRIDPLSDFESVARPLELSDEELEEFVQSHQA